MIRCISYFLFFSISFVSIQPAWAQTEKVFQTKFTTIHYAEDAQIDSFIWRLGGQRLEYLNEPELASYRIDRLIERVSMILDMYPENFHIEIHLRQDPLPQNKIAYFEYDTNAIYSSVDRVSDGVMAHELAHAIIVRYFPTPPPSKVQEILAQYVDKQLWSDY